MPQDMKSAQTMEDDNAPASDTEMPKEGENKTANTVTLDLTDPANENLKTCEPGEMLSVKSNDGETIVLEKHYGEGGDEEGAAEDAGESGEEPKGALAILMAKKAK